MRCCPAAASVASLYRVRRYSLSTLVIQLNQIRYEFHLISLPPSFSAFVVVFLALERITKIVSSKSNSVGRPFGASHRHSMPHGIMQIIRTCDWLSLCESKWVNECACCVCVCVRVCVYNYIYILSQLTANLVELSHSVNSWGSCSIYRATIVAWFP